MLNEVKFSKFVDTGKNVTTINLEDFIKCTQTRPVYNRLVVQAAFFSPTAVYINHRPAFGLSPAELSRAFVVLSGEEEQSGILDRAKLLSLLQEKGWHCFYYFFIKCHPLYFYRYCRRAHYRNGTPRVPYDFARALGQSRSRRFIFGGTFEGP